MAAAPELKDEAREAVGPGLCSDGQVPRTRQGMGWRGRVGENPFTVSSWAVGWRSRVDGLFP